MKDRDKTKEQLLSELSETRRQDRESGMKGKAGILIVDDHESSRRTLTLILKKEGYETETAGTGREAIKKAQEKFFNAALLDIKLPDVEGLELIAPLKKMRPDMVIIIITAFASVENAAGALSEGASAYLVKPLNMDEVLTAVRGGLEKQRLVIEKRQAEEELKESEEKYRSLIEISPEAIFLYNLNGDFVSVNQAACAIYGYSREEFTKLNVKNIIPEDRAERFPLLVENLRKKKQILFESVGRKKNGTEFPLEMISNLFHIRGEELVQVWVKDITERKKAEEALRKANQELRKLDQLKSEFLATVSHELRTPLASIKIGVSQITDEMLGKVNENQKEVLSDVLAESDRMTRLINGLLDISKIEAGRMLLRKSSLGLNDLVKKTAVKFKKSAEQKGVKLKFKPGRGIPPVFADPDGLERILTNLIDNSLKFTPAGGEVRIEVGKEGEYAKCSVSDTGVGITPENLKDIFSQFKHLAPTPGVEAGGAGLGLAITKRLVEMHCGQIRAESRVGEGSRFTFKLPDFGSEESLREYLTGRVGWAKGEGGHLALLGIKLENPDGLKKALGGKILPFLERLVGIIGDETDLRPDVWLREETGELMFVVEGKDRKEIRQNEEQVWEKLGKYRFFHSSEPIALKLSLAFAIYPYEASDEVELIKSLRDHLSRHKPRPLRAEGKVLIADDDESMVELTSAILEADDFKTLKARNGRQVLTLASKRVPDLILLDMILPDIDGYEVIDRLRERPDTGDIPLIAFSGHDIDASRLSRSAAEPIPTLAKPFDTKKLIKLVYQVLDLKVVNI